MTTLVTGTGLVGPHVVQALIDEAGERPVVYGTLRAPSLVTALGDRVTVVRGDVLDLASLIAALQAHQAHTIVHTAVIMSQAASAPYAAVQTNVLGTVHVLEAARLAGCRRVVFASTGRVYAPHDGPSGLHHETDPIGGQAGLYPATKVASEELGRAYAAQRGVELVTVRLTSMYGPIAGQSGGNGGLIQQAVAQAAHGEPIVIPRRSTGRLEVTYVKDAARGLARVARAASLPWDVVNVGSGHLASLDDVAATLSDLAGVPARVDDPRRGQSPMAGDEDCLDLTRAATVGYVPRYDLRAGLADYLAWTRGR